MASDAQPTPISFGLTYVPRQAGAGWWQHDDRGAIRDELAQIADLGFDTIRIALTWEEFQPGPRRVGSRALRVLEQTLESAQLSGLRTVLLLFPATWAGVLTIPAWANGASLIDELTGSETSQPIVVNPGRLPVWYDGSYHLNHARDLYSYRPTVAAQRYLIDEVASYFGKHPAVWMWQLGEGFERVRRPASVTAARTWYGAMADRLRLHQPSASILGVTSLRALAGQDGPQPAALLAGCTQLGIVADPPEPPALPTRHTTFAAFAHALITGLSDTAAFVTALGMPSTEQLGGHWQHEAVYGRNQAVFYGDLEQQAIFYSTVVERLHQAGAAGIWLSSYADAPQSAWHLPPYDRAARSRTLGIIDASGREKPAAHALRELFRSLRTSTPGPTRQQIDPEWFGHNPRAALAELWAGFEGRS